MGNLFDELKKAKLIDKKRAKQLLHEKRIEHSEQGGDTAKDKKLADKAKNFAARQEEEKQQHRSSAQAQKAASRERERRAEIRQLVASRQLGNGAAGSKRWHFRAPSGARPFLPVNDTTSRRLQVGEYAIIRDPAVTWPRYVIIPRDVALKLREVEEGAICWLA